MILAQAMQNGSFLENNKHEVIDYEIQTTGHMSGMYPAAGGTGGRVL
jgi:hypothetical protein